GIGPSPPPPRVPDRAGQGSKDSRTAPTRRRARVSARSAPRSGKGPQGVRPESGWPGEIRERSGRDPGESRVQAVDAAPGAADTARQTAPTRPRSRSRAAARGTGGPRPVLGGRAAPEGVGQPGPLQGATEGRPAPHGPAVGAHEERAPGGD